MRLLHTSDWHLGRFMKLSNDLMEDQQDFIQQIERIIEEKQVDALLIAGDVYDRAVASAETIALYDAAMTEIVIRRKTPVLLVAGNHDGAARLASCSRLLRECGLHICGSLTREPTKVELGDAEIFLLPWLTADKVRALFPEDAEQINDLTQAYQYVCDRIRTMLTPGKKHILLAHAFIVDAETSTSDRSAEIGLATAVSASVFDGFDYVALGHIHKPQSVSEKIRYSGTPMPYAFGREETQQKSVTLLDTDTMTQEEIPLRLLHPRKTLEGTLQELLALPLTEELQRSYLRLRVTDVFLDGESRARLENKFPHVIEAAGRLFEDETSGIHLTQEELEQMENDPVEIFRRFCEDVANTEADQHKIALFEEALRQYEKEVALQ